MYYLITNINGSSNNLLTKVSLWRLAAEIHQQMLTKRSKMRPFRRTKFLNTFKGKMTTYRISDSAVQPAYP